MSKFMTEFDLSAAVDAMFANAAPGEILREWNEWGCGKYAEAGEPYFDGPREKLIPVKASEPGSVFMEYTVHTFAEEPSEALEPLEISSGGCSVLRFIPAGNRELALAA